MRFTYLRAILNNVKIINSGNIKKYIQQQNKRDGMMKALEQIYSLFPCTSWLELKTKVQYISNMLRQYRGHEFSCTEFSFRNFVRMLRIWLVRKRHTVVARVLRTCAGRISNFCQWRMRSPLWSKNTTLVHRLKMAPVRCLFWELFTGERNYLHLMGTKACTNEAVLN